MSNISPSRHPSFRLFRDLVEDDGLLTPGLQDSPLHRAGSICHYPSYLSRSLTVTHSLLQPMSHASSYSSRPQILVPHSQDTIRYNTVQLSHMIMIPPINADADASLVPSLSAPPQDNADRTTPDFIFPFIEPIAAIPDDLESDSFFPASSHSSCFSSNIAASPTVSHTTTSPHRPLLATTFPFRPSGLSLLLSHHREPSSHSLFPPVISDSHRVPHGPPAPPQISHLDRLPEKEGTSSTSRVHTSSQKKIDRGHPDDALPISSSLSTYSTSDLTETVPLLNHDFASCLPSYSQPTPGPHPSTRAPVLKATSRCNKHDRSVIVSVREVSALIKKAVQPTNIQTVLVLSVQSLPAVVLGSLLNILDGVSYGMILFPAVGVFADLGPTGVSMFFVSTLVAQLVYTFGGSGFAGANGSMMIEVVPFFHVLASSIAQGIGEDKPREVLATTLAAYVLSSILTGISFFLLGVLKLGVIIGFVPRHILVGCIGGIGVFLIETGLTVSLRIADDDLTMSWETLKFVFLNTHNLALWTIPLGLAILLRVITHKYRHQLIFPLYFIAIPTVFYVVVAASRSDMKSLREAGWVFDLGQASQASWYKFYSYFDLNAISFGTLWSTMPTQLALLFFNVLHPPLNVPALAVSLNEDVDTDKELVAHGYSNLLAAICGTVPNYLVYINTVLFYRVGGGTRIAGFLLAMATVLLLYIGTGPIAFLPVMVVGALIFVLGIDLVMEALWDTRHRVTWMEYITIIGIMAAMTWWDFVTGVLFGIIVSCLFFVIQNSQRESIRAFHSGETVMSTVRRPGVQRAYIREVSKQTTILRLQGFLFFGTITSVERTIREAIEGPSWHKNPIRFLVLDLSLVAGVDMSAAEAFVRIHRLLVAKYITLVFCGFSADSATGKALHRVGVLGGERIELFSTFSDAMEWTENAYLRAWFRSQKTETSPMVALPGRQDADIVFQRSLASSPRLSHLYDAGTRTIAHELLSQSETEVYAEPYNTLIKTFSSYGQLTAQEFRKLVPYFVRMAVPEGHVLWKQDDPPDGLYIMESGILRAVYKFADHTLSVEESMVPGTLAGELSALSSLPRNATMTVERAAVLWKLSIRQLRQLEVDEPALASVFTQVLLKAAKIDYDILLSALATRQ